MMSAEKALEIVDDCSRIGVKAIQFTGGGEPTVHPAFADVVSRVHEHGMKFALVSNGTRMSEKLAELVVQGSWVRISLDSAKPETYTSVRQVGINHWKKANIAVKLLRETRDRLKTDCVIGVGFTVTPENWKEIYDATLLARDLGADNFRISAMFSSDDEKPFEPFHSSAASLAKLAETCSNSSFQVVNRFSDRIDDLKAKRPTDKLCGYQFFTTYIGADLNVYRCCGQAYNENGLIGSLKNQSFADFWMSHERFSNQLGFDGRNCERCQFRHINSALAYALEPQLHEEFV